MDIAGSAQPSGGLLFSARNAEGVQSAAFVSGKLPLRCRETNPDKLTLSFSLSASSTRPVTVRVESFDSHKKRTGGREAQIFPAAPDFYQRYALDLFQMKAVGAGRFRATDPFVQFTFAVGPHSPGDSHAEPCLRRCAWTMSIMPHPAYYVSPHGSDANDGRTEATAFANPQKALDVSRPGDIIDVMNGTYISPNGPSTSPPRREALSPVANFTHPGTPAAWIVLKNYPGQQPTFFSNGWNIVSMGLGSNEKPDTGPALAYLEIRGLHVRGEGDVVKTKYPDCDGQARLSLQLQRHQH